MEHLFVYGTLRDPRVQKRLFERELTGFFDELTGYRRDKIRIPDNAEGTVYPIITYTGASENSVKGTVLELNQDDLQIADRYEGADYRRKEVHLNSGIRAWTYTSR